MGCPDLTCPLSTGSSRRSSNPTEHVALSAWYGPNPRPPTPPPTAPGQHPQNAVLWLFLAALCFIFRMREDNPYLVLDEEGGETGAPEFFCFVFGRRCCLVGQEGQRLPGGG